MITVHHLHPPWREPGAPTAASPSQPGVIQLIAIPPGKPDAEEIEACTARLRRAAPGCPVALWAANADVELITRLALVMGQCAIRGLIIGRATSGLREQLAATTALAGCIARWAIDVNGAIDRRLASDLHALLDEATRHATAGTSVQQLGGAERTWRAHFRAARLPSPGRWVHMVHTLLPALALQRDPDRPVAHVAEEFGAYDAASLSSRLRAAFGRGPTHIRQLLGFEPLLHTWLARAGAPVPAPVRAPTGRPRPERPLPDKC